MKRKIMKFDLKNGKIYLTVEKSPFTALEALEDLRNVGYKGSVISRSSIEDLNLQPDEDLKYYWLSETEIHSESDNMTYLKPDLHEIERHVTNIPEKHFVFLDSLDFLILKNGFEETLSFVQRLREMAYLKQLIAILSLDNRTLDKQQLSLVKNETEIEPIYRNLHQNALKVLEFVLQQNSKGVKPTYTKVSQGLGITRQSASKWVKYLASEGYLKEDRVWKNKIAEVTKKGSYLLRSG